MRSSVNPLPEYDNPPVIEVVFGIQYKELDKLKAPHIGLIWEKIGKDDYPECQEVPPLVHVLETYGSTPTPPRLTIEALKLPPLPRLLFVSSGNNHLVQIQRDRFLQNWRKLSQDVEYPRYSALFPRFVNGLKIFSEAIEDLGIGRLEPNQYELTYVNHLVQGEGWDDLSDIGKVFRGFQCQADDRFLPEPEEVSWRRNYRFPEEKGRLHVSMQQAVSNETQVPLLVLNLTARGFDDDLASWFEIAHEWIVRGFADLTGPEIQKTIWKRSI